MSRAIPLLVILSSLMLTTSCAREVGSTMGVAASLRVVMPDLAQAFEEETGERAPEFSFGASGTLSKQLEAGAPLSAVVLASAEQIDSLIERGLLTPESRAELAQNTLVLAARRGEGSGALSELQTVGPMNRIAMGDPRFVPAGRHAREALESRGLYSELSPHAIFTRDVTAAVALLRRGEVKRALIYATDARHHEDLEILESLVDPELQRPVVVAASVPEAETVSGFLAFLSGPSAAAIFDTHGFEVSRR
jgi:molybdate transport system substrate-binding protein